MIYLRGDFNNFGTPKNRWKSRLKKRFLIQGATNNRCRCFAVVPSVADGVFLLLFLLRTVSLKSFPEQTETTKMVRTLKIETSVASQSFTSQKLKMVGRSRATNTGQHHRHGFSKKPFPKMHSWQTLASACSQNLYARCAIIAHHRTSCQKKTNETTTRNQSRCWSIMITALSLSWGLWAPTQNFWMAAANSAGDSMCRACLTMKSAKLPKIWSMSSWECPVINWRSTPEPITP